MAHGSEGQLGKGLRQRHLAMIAIGGVIGAGLFVGSGAVIAEVGPLCVPHLRAHGCADHHGDADARGDGGCESGDRILCRLRTPVDRRVGRLLGGLALLVLLGDRRGL